MFSEDDDFFEPRKEGGADTGALSRRRAWDVAFHGLIRVGAGWRGSADTSLAVVAAASWLVDAVEHGVEHKGNLLEQLKLPGLTPAKHAGIGVLVALLCYVLLYKAGCRAKTVAKDE